MVGLLPVRRTCTLSFSGTKLSAASMRGFDWSKFQPRTCSGCKINGLGEDL